MTQPQILVVDQEHAWRVLSNLFNKKEEKKNSKAMWRKLHVTYIDNIQTAIQTLETNEYKLMLLEPYIAVPTGDNPLRELLTQAKNTATRVFIYSVMDKFWLDKSYQIEPYDYEKFIPKTTPSELIKTLEQEI